MNKYRTYFKFSTHSIPNPIQIIVEHKNTKSENKIQKELLHSQKRNQIMSPKPQGEKLSLNFTS